MFEIVLSSPIKGAIVEPTEAVVLIFDAVAIAGMLEAGHVDYLNKGLRDYNWQI